MARFQNTSPEPFLRTDFALFSVDSSFVGGGEMPEIPSGGEAVLAFGPVEDLRLERVVLDLNEGDRGLISRSNTRDEEVRVKIENLGEKSWPVELLDRVPFSEQEDLVVTFSASPPPVQRNFEDRRGILQWEFDLPPGAEKSILLTKNIRWPEGMVLSP